MKKSKKNNDIVTIDEGIGCFSNDNKNDAVSVYYGDDLSITDDVKNNDEVSLIDNEYSITNAGESEILQKYIKHVSQFPILTKEEEDKYGVLGIEIKRIDE